MYPININDFAEKNMRISYRGWERINNGTYPCIIPPDGPWLRRKILGGFIWVLRRAGVVTENVVYYDNPTVRSIRVGRNIIPALERIVETIIETGGDIDGYVFMVGSDDINMIKQWGGALEDLLFLDTPSFYRYRGITLMASPYMSGQICLVPKVFIDKRYL